MICTNAPTVLTNCDWRQKDCWESEFFNIWALPFFNLVPCASFGYKRNEAISGDEVGLFHYLTHLFKNISEADFSFGWKTKRQTKEKQQSKCGQGIKISSIITEAVACKKGVLRNFAKFTRKHLCQSLFFSKVAGWDLKLHWRKDSGTGVFVNFAKFLRTPFLKEHLW